MAEPEQGIECLRRRVERLEALESARQLLAKYCRACDVQDMDALVELFVADCRLDTGTEARNGVEEVISFFRQAWADDPVPKRHFVTNVSAVDVRPEAVTVDAYFLYISTEHEPSVLGWGEYRDEVEIAGASPRFRKKSIHMGRLSDVPHGAYPMVGPDRRS